MTRWALSAVCASVVAFTGPVRAEEPEQGPAQLFESLDSNQDQLVTSEEVDGDRQSFFARLIRLGDADGDGRLTQEEFVIALAMQDDQPRDEGDRSERRGPGEGPMFERLDRNRDGKITKDEIPEGAPEALRQRLNRLFERASKDELTREDFARPAGRPPQGERPPLGVEVFKRWDKNGDGNLSRDEVPEFVRPRLERIFDRLGSDTASFDELEKAIDRREAQRADRESAGRDSDRRSGGDRRPEGDRRNWEDRMTRRPEGERPSDRGFGPGRSGDRRGGPALLRILDTDRDGRLSRDEVSKFPEKFSELDRNDDGQLDGFELFAMGGGFGGRMGPGAPGARFGGPPRGGEGREEGDRPGRPEFGREPGERGPRGDDDRRPQEMRRDGDRPRPPQGRDDDRGREEGDRPGRPDGQAFRGGRPRSPEARFASADRDGERRGPQFASRGRGANFLSRIDRDGDGAISRDEATEQMRERFERLDLDGNGKVTFEEFHRAILREYGLDQPSE